MNLLQRFNAVVNNWLLYPEANASGRLGIFRIIWSIFVLCMALAAFHEDIAQIPIAQWHIVPALTWLDIPPSANVITTITLIRIIAVVYVLFGYQTRLATGLVLLAAIFLEGLTFSFGKHEHNDTFAYIYIPAIMLLYNWGQTYSVDAIIREKKTNKTVDVHDGSWHHGWSIKLVAILLAVLYFGAAYIKIVNSHWIQDPQHLSNLLLIRNLVNPNPLTYWIGSNYTVAFVLQIMTLVFEALFPLFLINKTWRMFFLASGVVFHFSIYVLMHPPFHQLVFVYAIFLDWQRIGEWIKLPVLYERVKQISTPILLVFVSSVALVAALLRLFILPPNTLEIIEPVWIGIIWAVSVPLAIGTLAYTVPQLLEQILAMFRKKTPVSAASVSSGKP